MPLHSYNDELWLPEKCVRKRVTSLRMRFRSKKCVKYACLCVWRIGWHKWDFGVRTSSLVMTLHLPPFVPQLNPDPRRWAAFTCPDQWTHVAGKIEENLGKTCDGMILLIWTLYKLNGLKTGTLCCTMFYSKSIKLTLVDMFSRAKVSSCLTLWREECWEVNFCKISHELSSQ